MNEIQPHSLRMFEFIWISSELFFFPIRASGAKGQTGMDKQKKKKTALWYLMSVTSLKYNVRSFVLFFCGKYKSPKVTLKYRVKRTFQICNTHLKYPVFSMYYESKPGPTDGSWVFKRLIPD